MLAVNKMQADIAGLTGPNDPPHTASPVTPSEVFHNLVHGESGSLSYLFSDLVTPVTDTLRPADRVGPHGGTGRSAVGVLRPQGPTPGPSTQPVPYPVTGFRIPPLVGQPAGPIPVDPHPAPVPYPALHHTEAGPNFA